MKRIAAILISVTMCISAAFFSACAEKTSDSLGSDPSAQSGTNGEINEDKAPKGKVEGVEYAAESVDDIDYWSTENSLNNDACRLAGIVRSPYFEVRINAAEVSVFAERTTHGVHSFAYADIYDAEDGMALDVEITTHEERTNPVVLPENAGVTATVQGKTVKARIVEYGAYTFTFDRDGVLKDGSQLPLTLMIKPREEPVVPAGYAVREIEPGEYPISEMTFTEENTLYYFKKGAYTIDGMEIPSNSVVYYEPGCVFSVKPLTMDEATGKPAVGDIISSKRTENVKILGRAAFDFSYRAGNDTNFRLAFSFELVKNLSVSGLNSVNSAGWTVCFTNCEDVSVRDLIVIAYRTYSDGVMLSDCKNASVSGCFVRTGDDAMEVKSTSSGSVKTDNVVFENNAVWTDKGIAYGAVYESNHDQRNVIWRNNSVGFALAQWTDHLGCTTVCMEGKSADVVDEDLHFENIEIYTSYCPVTTIVLHNGGTVRNIYFKKITAKYVSLNPDIFRGAIDLMVRNTDRGDIEDFQIKTLYFDYIEIGGEKLTNSNKTEMVTHKFADGFVFDYKYIRVDTQL